MRPQKIVVNCKTCGKELLIPPCRIRENGNYCGKQCFDKAQTQNIKINCLYCKKEFKTTQSDLKWHNRKFCSAECRNLYVKGINHPKFKPRIKNKM